MSLPTLDQVLQAAKPALEAAGPAAKSVVPWLQIVGLVLDVLVTFIGGKFGAQLPNADQLMKFTVMVKAAAVYVAGAMAYDWYRDDGYAGGKTLELLGPMTEAAGWPAAAQLLFVNTWWDFMVKLPGKGGGAGRNFWRAKLKAFEAGQKVEFTVPGTKIKKTVAKGVTLAQAIGACGAGYVEVDGKCVPKSRQTGGALPGYDNGGGPAKKRLLAWSQGLEPALIGGVPCERDMGPQARCMNGTIIGTYMWNLTQQQVSQLNAGLYELLVDLPTAEEQVEAWKAIARSRLRELGIGPDLYGPVYGYDGVAANATGGKAAAGVGVLTLITAALAVLAKVA